jgi:PAS domain S-box-containing protein
MNMNPEFERILGRTSQDLANIKWPEITHPDDLQADLAYFESFKTGKIPGYSMEKRFLRADGTSVWTNMTVSHLLGSPISIPYTCAAGRTIHTPEAEVIAER